MKTTGTITDSFFQAGNIGLIAFTRKDGTEDTLFIPSGRKFMDEFTKAAKNGAEIEITTQNKQLSVVRINNALFDFSNYGV